MADVERGSSPLHEKGDFSSYAKGKEGSIKGDAEVRLAQLDPEGPDGAVQRKLKARHIQMIAIGGCIGTGLFVGSGAALANGGPGGMLLGYTIMGGVVYGMMVALGELSSLYPVSGAWVHFAGRFVDDGLAFAVGWNYWYSFGITLPTEITAAAIVIQYWDQTTNVAVYISVFLVFITACNFGGVRYYGEAEFWMALVKVIAIIGLIILGIVIDLGGTPNGDRIGFRYWKDPGFFVQSNGIGGATGRFLAFWSTLTQAAFSFQGTEIVALAAGEAENPRRNIPRAIKTVFYRILLFYVGGVTVIGLTVQSTNPRLLSDHSDASASPFVIAIDEAGIKVLPSIINAVILTSAFSAGNSDLYASSRTLYGLACDGYAPAFLKRCTKGGLPIYAVAITALFGPLAFLNADPNTTGGTVFNYFYNITTITGLLTWCTILYTYIRFYHGLKAQGIDRNAFPYKAPLQPYLTYFSLFFMTLVTIFNGWSIFLRGNWDTSDFIVAYISLPAFAILFAGWKIVKRTRWIRLDEMDFLSGRRQLDEIDAVEQEKWQTRKPQTPWAKAWAWLA